MSTETPTPQPKLPEPRTNAEEARTGTLNSWLSQYKDEHPAQCENLPEHVITQIYNAVSNSITALEDRDQGEMEVLRREIFTAALNNAQSLAKQTAPTGEKCPRWNQVVSGSIRVAQQATARKARTATATTSNRDRHQKTEDAPNPTGAMKAMPLPDDSLSFKILEGANVGNAAAQADGAGLDPAMAALVAAGIITAGAAIAASRASTLEISDTTGPVGTSNAALDDPYHFRRQVLLGRGQPLPAEMQQHEAVIRPHPATAEATADRSEKASAEFQKRIEAQREQDAFAPKEHAAGA